MAQELIKCKTFIVLFSIFSFSSIYLQVKGIETITLATFLPLTGNWPVGRTIQSAAVLAAEAVNNNPHLLPGHEINISYHETGCNQGVALLEVVRVFTSTDPTEAIIGDGCDIICQPFGQMAAEFGLPMISWGCSGLTLSDKSQYSTFARTVGPRQYSFDVVMSVLHMYDWSRIGIISLAEGTWEWLAQAIKTQLEIHEEGQVRQLYRFEPGRVGYSQNEMDYRRESLYHVIQELKVLVLCAGGGDVRQIMLDAYDMGLMNGEYAFITIDLTSEDVFGANTWMGDDGRDEDAKKAFQGLINIYIRKPDTVRYNNFEDRVRARNAESPFHYEFGPQEQVNVHAGMLYDAIMLYAHALHDALEQGYNQHDGRVVSRLMFNRTFEGITGDVHIDENGDRLNDYSVQVFKNDRFVTFADYLFDEGVLTMYPDVEVIFPGGRLDPPPDHPTCGWENELCTGTSYRTIFSVVGAVIVTAVLLGVGSLLMYRRLKFEADVNSEQLWRINPEDLLPAHNSSNKFAKDDMCTGTQSCRKIKDRKSNLNLSEPILQQKHSAPHSKNSDNQMFADVAIYKGMVVCLKHIKKSGILVNRNLLLDFKKARELHHENINVFIGASIDEPLRCIVTAYCTRGSLNDVLENGDIKLNEDFKLSFAHDICKGMEYFHNSNLGSHGRLKSSNCVIDNRWMVKITDYGLVKLREGNKQREVEDEIFRALQWTAPEILRSPNAAMNGSKKGDVFSYAIILQEIALRSVPYCMLEKGPREIVQLVQVGLNPPFRPTVPRDSCPNYMHDLMTACWEEAPENRPTFLDIKRKIIEANIGKNLNILDNMLQMMEQYADHLEDLVTDRTRRLEEEKKKTDKLLYEMLPKSVADGLKVGKFIHPEAYEKATVYFSDIVGFTELASASTPLEVVTFLNDLYHVFDGIIDHHDVYKVETIGDAYMVVSGVPVRNGDNHAGEIASLALDILSSITTFKIRHKPDKQMQLRIGIHSGPVVAGVVGHKMPRYCLFGDTVTTASKLESTAMALRVHISEETKNVLTQLGGYDTVPRGIVDIPGKGQVTTYWLQGKHGFNKILPFQTTSAHAEIDRIY